MSDNALFLLPALRRARDLIDRDYARPLDLDAMAREAGYSRFHFARAFAAAYGETPRTYLTRRRIERAKTLLRTANLSVTEICLLVGFESLGSFSSRFRQLVGQSPTRVPRRRGRERRRPADPRLRRADVDATARPRFRKRGEARAPGRAPRLVRAAAEGGPMISQAQPRQRVRARPGPGEAVLHRDARLRAPQRLRPRRLPLAHGRARRTSRTSRILLAYPAPPMFSPEDAETVRALVAKGSLGGGVFETDDCRKTFEELSAKGVTFLQEPAERPYGIEALFRDDSGQLVQPHPAEVGGLSRRPGYVARAAVHAPGRRARASRGAVSAPARSTASARRACPGCRARRSPRATSCRPCARARRCTRASPGGWRGSWHTPRR